MAKVVDKSNALIPWEEQLAKDAAISAGMEASTGSSLYFSMKSGVLSFNDMPMPDNQIAVIILDTILENVFYEGVFNAADPAPPVCFAFGREEADLVPHEVVFDHDQQRSDTCPSCPKNAWGTANVGKGKACRNTRRMALLPAGTLIDNRFKPYTEEDHFIKSAYGVMKLPVTSVKGYGIFVKQITSVHSAPPYGFFTKIKVVPDAVTQFKVLFEVLGKIPNHIGPIIMQRRKEAAISLDIPYNLDREAERPSPAYAPPKESAAVAAKRRKADNTKY